MIQHNHSGRKADLHSTVHIVRDLKIMMRRDPEAAALAVVDDDHTAPAGATPHPDRR